MRNLHLPGRSNVLSANGIAATSQPLSSLEAISVLKKGGNAIDAAIAASAVQTVVEPGSTGVGGDCFALISMGNKSQVAINGSGIAPKKFGKLDFDELFISAENYARNGYPVHEICAESWKKNINKILNNESSKKIFSKNEKPYKFGEIHKNIQLAETLKSIAKNNIKDFYQGYIAKDIVETLNELGGVHTIEDFENQKTIFSESLSNSYKENI